MNNLLGGQVQVLFGTTAVAIEHVRGGKVRAQGLEVGWVRRVSDPSPRWTVRALFCGETTGSAHACTSGRQAKWPCNGCAFGAGQVTPLFLRCFFSLARNTDGN
jgi:hypothetical protein